MKRLTDRQIALWQKSVINALNNISNVERRVREHRPYATGSKYTFVNDTLRELKDARLQLEKTAAKLNKRFQQIDQQMTLGGNK